MMPAVITTRSFSLMYFPDFNVSTEIHLDHALYRGRKVNKMDKKNISNQVSYAAVSTADALSAAAIVAPSITGFTTRMLSKWRPSITVIGLSPSARAVRQMQLYWGVVPIEAKRAQSSDELITASLQKAKEMGYLHKDELVVVTAGVIADKHERKPATHTNIMQIELVK